MGAESALVDGARVDTALGGDCDNAAQWETDVTGATRAAESPVRCCYCRRCQLLRDDASGGTGMPFQTLGESPCARAARDASEEGMGQDMEMWREREGAVQGRVYYRGQGGDRGRGHRDVSHAPWRRAGKVRLRCATRGRNESQRMNRWIGAGGLTRCGDRE